MKFKDFEGTYKTSTFHDILRSHVTKNSEKFEYDDIMNFMNIYGEYAEGHPFYGEDNLVLIKASKEAKNVKEYYDVFMKYSFDEFYESMAEYAVNFTYDDFYMYESMMKDPDLFFEENRIDDDEITSETKKPFLVKYKKLIDQFYVWHLENEARHEEED